MEMAQSFDIVSYLVTVCPALGILAWIVVHFKSELNKKDERISELTEHLIDVSRDQIKVNSEMKNLMEMLLKK